MRLYLDFTSYPEMKMAHGKYKCTGKLVMKKYKVFNGPAVVMGVDVLVGACGGFSFCLTI